MNTNWNIKTLIEAVGYAALIAIFAAMSLYMSSGMILSMFLCTVLLVVLIVRIDEIAAVFAVIVSYILVFIITDDFLTSAIIISRFCFPGLALGWGFKRKKDFRSLFVLSSSAYLFNLLLVIFLANKIYDVNLINQFILDPIEKMFTQIKESEDIAKLFGRGSIDITVLDELKDTISFFVPGFLLLAASFSGFLMLMFTKFILNRLKYDYSYLPMFSQLKVGRTTVAVFVLSFLISRIITNSVISAALLNIAFILSAVLNICGLSVIDFFLKRYGIPGIVRVIIYIIGLNITMFVGLLIPIIHPFYILAVLALADSIFDFRKLGK
ncbi:MAG: DUF2232 domain-containing protein [Clostridiaceae bacterium]|nr:DUF2232 domain-containing protein [Clostridiaceae bacterium]